MDKISIIVPIYNKEKYLKKCIESIMQQTYENIEIILVNDGSMDNSLKICCEYQKIDGRIKIIDKKNEGVSIARNSGLEAATGRYIGFVDPDDWIESMMFENLCRTIKKHKCSIAFCNYYKDSKLGSNPKIIKVQKDVLGKLEIINELISNMISVEDIFPKYYNVMGSVWRCLYEKEFIDKFNLKFKQGISIMEDLIFNIEALIYCDRVCIDQGVYYHYVRNRSSVLRSYNEKMWHDQVLVHNTLENILRDAELDEYMRNRLDLRYLGMAACALGNEVYDRDANLIGKMEKAKYIMNDKRLKEVLDRSKVYNIESLREHRNKDEKESREDSERVTNVIKNLLEHIM